MNKIHRIAIVGAGVAGMALAILARRKGYYVRLYERDSKVSSIGAGVTLWPNAIFVLQQMGLEQEIKRLGGRETANTNVQCESACCTIGEAAQFAIT